MKEFEIRPRELFDAYLELSRRDSEVFFSDAERFVAIPCPACGSDGGREAFRKHGFVYRECDSASLLGMPWGPAMGAMRRMRPPQRGQASADITQAKKRSRMGAAHFYRGGDTSNG